MKITILTPTNNPSKPHHTNLADLLKRGLARFKLSSEKRVSVECDGVEIIVEATQEEPTTMQYARIVFTIIKINGSRSEKYSVFARPVFSNETIERDDYNKGVFMCYATTRQEALNAIERESKPYGEYAIFE